MLKLNKNISHFVRLLLQMKTGTTVYIPTLDLDTRITDGGIAQPFLDYGCPVSGIAEKETAFTFSASQQGYYGRKFETLVCENEQHVRMDSAFHFAFALPPVNDDASFQWKVDTFRNWEVSRYFPEFTAPRHLMTLESLRSAVLPGCYFAAVLPQTWVGTCMKFMKYWNKNAGMVARILLPKGAVERFRIYEDDELLHVDPRIRREEERHQDVLRWCRSVSQPMITTGNSDRWFLFIWQRPVDEGVSRDNKLFYAKFRHSVFTAKLPSLEEEHTEFLAGQFRKSDWYKLSVKIYNDMVSSTSDSRYIVSTGNYPETIPDPKNVRVLKLGEKYKSKIEVMDTVDEIKRQALAAHIKLGSVTKVCVYNPVAAGALLDFRRRLGYPAEDRNSKTDKRPTDRFAIKLTERSLSENRDFVLKALTDAGLTPTLTANDERRLKRQDRWLNIQLSPIERTIKAQTEDDEDIWETIYDEASIQSVYPEVWNLWLQRAISMKLDSPKWTYEFQFYDIVTQVCKSSILNGNHMGLGKTRETLFTMLLRGTSHNLIIVPSRLIGVWQNEIESTIANYVRSVRRNWAGKSMSADYQVIQWARDCDRRNLRTFNIISYENLSKVPKDALFFVCPQCKFVVCSLKETNRQACPRCNHGRTKSAKAHNKLEGLRKHKAVINGKVTEIDNRVSSGNPVWMYQSENHFDKMSRVKYTEIERDPITGEEVEVLKEKDVARKPHLKWTFSKLLRGKFNMVAIEEANYISNPESQRSMALNMVTARHRLALSGTPVRGYPRSICNMLNWTFKRDVFPDYRPSEGKPGSGAKKFENKYATIVHREGQPSKLIPKINQPEVFQQEIAPLMLRHQRYEPLVAKSVPPKYAVIRMESIPMDPEHKDYYQKWLDVFAEWWQKKREEEGQDAKLVNDLLVKLGYLINASTIPHFMLDNIKGDDGAEWARIIGKYKGSRLPAKFERAKQLIQKNAAKNEKTIVFCTRRANIKLGHAWCLSTRKSKNPIYSITIDGSVSNAIKPGLNRSEKQLRVDKFCFQNYQVLWAGTKTMKEGFNIPQANHGVFIDYTWEPADWEQGIGRMLRPDQDKIVHGTFLCHEGTCDEYVAAWVQLKQLSEKEGIDHQVFDTFTASMIPDFRLYADAIVEGSTKELAAKMWSDVDELRSLIDDQDDS